MTRGDRSGPVSSFDIELAAALVFRREGYRGSTMAQIAEEVGLHKTSLYHHIKSKESLLISISRFAIVEPLAKLQEIVADPELTNKAKLHAAVHAQTLVVTERTNFIAVFTMYASDINDEQLRESFLERRRSYGAIFRELVRSCLDETGKPDSPSRVSDAILGMCNWMLHWYQPDGLEKPAALADSFATLALRMVGWNE